MQTNKLIIEVQAIALDSIDEYMKQMKYISTDQMRDVVLSMIEVACKNIEAIRELYERGE